MPLLPAKARIGQTPRRTHLLHVCKPGSCEAMQEIGQWLGHSSPQRQRTKGSSDSGDSSGHRANEPAYPEPHTRHSQATPRMGFITQSHLRARRGVAKGMTCQMAQRLQGDLVWRGTGNQKDSATSQSAAAGDRKEVPCGRRAAHQKQTAPSVCLRC